MAWSKVQGAQSAGGANATSVAITAATAGNTLVSFFSQTGLNTPTCTGFTVESVSAVYNGSLSSLWVATKIAAGGETSVAWTAGAGGTGHGVVAFELAGGPASIAKDGVVVHTDNIASGTSASLAVATGTANSIVLLAVGADTSTGVISAWTGTNVATNVGTAAARVFGGHFITTSTISSTFTGNWTTAHVSGMIAISLKLSAGGTAWTQPLADSITMTDAIAKKATSARADSITMTDAATKAVGSARADSVTMTDVIAKSVGHSLGDSITVTDTISKHPGVARADSVTLTDALAKAYGLGRTDSVILADTIVKAMGLTKGDSVALVDSASPALNGGVIVTPTGDRVHVIIMGRFGIY